MQELLKLNTEVGGFFFNYTWKLKSFSAHCGYNNKYVFIVVCKSSLQQYKTTSTAL